MAKPIIKLNIQKVQARLVQHLTAKMNEVCLRLVAFVKNSMTVSNLGGKNPSSPGSTPNIGTGALKRSITFKVKVLNNEVVGAYGVGKGLASAYAKRLELGFSGTVNVREHSRNGKTIKAYSYHVAQMPRPFIKPAYQLNKKRIKKILTS